MEYSMYKTFARKYCISVRKVIEKYRFNKDFAVFYNNKKGETKTRVFFNESFKRKPQGIAVLSDTTPNTIIVSARTSLIDRLKAQQCELCGASEKLEMHHVRKLKDLKGKEPWKILMIARQRKTMALCQQCHKKIHNGG
jgi:hypothetical protein